MYQCRVISQQEQESHRNRDRTHLQTYFVEGGFAKFHHQHQPRSLSVAMLAQPSEFNEVRVELRMLVDSL